MIGFHSSPSGGSGCQNKKRILFSISQITIISLDPKPPTFPNVSMHNTETKGKEQGFFCFGGGGGGCMKLAS